MDKIKNAKEKHFFNIYKYFFPFSKKNYSHMFFNTFKICY